jgi:hypothetical protein
MSLTRDNDVVQTLAPLPQGILRALTRALSNMCPRRLAAVVLELISAVSLRKTGIFADRARDFRRFPPQDAQTGSSETKSNARKARIAAHSRVSRGDLPKRVNGWLTSQGSNFYVPSSKNAFDMSGEFPRIS